MDFQYSFDFNSPIQVPLLWRKKLLANGISYLLRVCCLFFPRANGNVLWLASAKWNLWNEICEMKWVKWNEWKEMWSNGKNELLKNCSLTYKVETRQPNHVCLLTTIRNPPFIAMLQEPDRPIVAYTFAIFGLLLYYTDTFFQWRTAHKKSQKYLHWKVCIGMWFHRWIKPQKRAAARE